MKFPQELTRKQQEIVKEWKDTMFKMKDENGGETKKNHLMEEEEDLEDLEEIQLDIDM